MMDKDREKNEIWQKYERSRRYLDQKGLVSRTNTYWDMYHGEQWKGLQSGGEELPMLNFIKPVVRYKVATVAQNSLVAVFSDLERRGDLLVQHVCRLLEKDFERTWEKARLDVRKWDIIKAAAVQGDAYLYFGTEDPEDAQVLMNGQVLFGDENEEDIQKQPYIMLYERLFVKDVKRIARENGVPESECILIGGDSETQYIVGDRDEVSGSGEDAKCTSILYMEKRNGVVHVARAVKECIYEPLHALENRKGGAFVSGLKRYQVVPFVWERMPNSARGNSEVKQLMPNQMELNKTLARRSMSVKMTAFPRIAYDATAVQNEEDLSTVGAAIAVQGASGSVDQMIQYLNPASMSHDAQALQADLLDMSMQLAGAQDTALGNIDPQRVSGVAIEAIRDQSALPLNEQMAAFRQFAEDLALFRYEMLCYTAEDSGVKVAYEDEFGQDQEEMIPVEVLESFQPYVRVDISPDNSWSKYAEQQELAGLLNRGQISLSEYIEVLPSNSALPVNKLRKVIERRDKDVGYGEGLPMPEVPEGIYRSEGVQGALSEV